MGKIFYIMGKSASGKDRIYSLLAAHKELNLKTLILYTTRPIRVGEQDGKNYYFVDDGKLEEFRKNGNLIEERAYHTVYGIWTYFTADDGQVNLASGIRRTGMFFIFPILFAEGNIGIQRLVLLPVGTLDGVGGIFIKI